jgi:hypothetical protein
MSNNRKAAIRELLHVANDVRDIKPANTTKEIELDKLKEVGPKYAPFVERAAQRQPTSMFGSGTVAAGASDLPSGKALKKCVKYPKDFDAYTNDPSKFRRDVAQFTGGRIVRDKNGRLKVFSKTGEEIGVDLHPFPKTYPDIGQTHSEESARYKVKIYPKKNELTIPKKTQGYKGKIIYEQMNVQTSKSFSDLITDLTKPTKKGYRIPKAAARTELLAKDLISVEKRRKITPSRRNELNHAKYMLNKAYNRRITYRDENGHIRTEEIDDAADRYMRNKTKKSPARKNQIAHPSTTSIKIEQMFAGLFNNKKKGKKGKGLF